MNINPLFCYCTWEMQAGRIVLTIRIPMFSSIPERLHLQLKCFQMYARKIKKNHTVWKCYWRYSASAFLITEAQNIPSDGFCHFTYVFKLMNVQVKMAAFVSLLGSVVSFSAMGLSLFMSEVQMFKKVSPPGVLNLSWCMKVHFASVAEVLPFIHSVQIFV